jgi:hypothetical protein
MEKPVETTTPIEEKHSINWGFVVWPFAVLLMYVLSNGPMMMMMEKEHISVDHRFVKMFYWPCGWAYFQTPLHKPLGMYMHLWVPNAFDKHGNLIRLPKVLFGLWLGSALHLRYEVVTA